MDKKKELLADQRSLSQLFSNAAKACEKQQRSEEAALFAELSGSLWDSSPHSPRDGSFESLRGMIKDDLAQDYPAINQSALEKGDRGIQRALRWGEKVSKIQDSLIGRYIDKKDQLLEGKKFFVCEACGFIFLGDQVPNICPVCKAPAKRFSTIA